MLDSHNQLLIVVTCVGAWVVTKWLVSCLGNSQVITRSCLKLVNLPPINCCVWWHVSCRGRKPTIQLRPTLLHKSPQAAADKKICKKSCKGWVRGVRHFTYKTLTCKCEWLPHNTLHLVSTLFLPQNDEGKGSHFTFHEGFEKSAKWIASTWSIAAESISYEMDPYVITQGLKNDATKKCVPTRDRELKKRKGTDWPNRFYSAVTLHQKVMKNICALCALGNLQDGNTDKSSILMG